MEEGKSLRMEVEWVESMGLSEGLETEQVLTLVATWARLLSGLLGDLSTSSFDSPSQAFSSFHERLLTLYPSTSSISRRVETDHKAMRFRLPLQAFDQCLGIWSRGGEVHCWEQEHPEVPKDHLAIGWNLVVTVREGKTVEE